MNNAVFGDFRTAILFCLIIALTVLISWLFRSLFQRYIKRNIKRFNEDPTNYQFIQHFMTGIIYMVGIGWAFLTLPHMETVAHTILAGAGVVTLVAGLASQQAIRGWQKITYPF